MALWKQAYKVVFTKQNITFEPPLKIAFQIDKDTTKESNKAKLEIYNLNETTRKAIEQLDNEVELYAGYVGEGGAVLCFRGTVIYGYTAEDTTDSITHLEIADGTVALRDSYCTLSYAQNVAAKVVIQRCANEMGVPLVYGEDVGDLEAYKNGFSFIGLAKDALTEVCNARGLSWSIQNNILQVIKAGGTSTNRGLVFSAYTGLIGAPERVIQAEYKSDKTTPRRKSKEKEQKNELRKKRGWRIHTLLSPTVNPADLVKVESKLITGWFRVEKASHAGEYNGNQWESALELTEIDNAKQATNE